VQICKSFTAFQDHGSLSFGRHLARSLSQLGTTVLPRFGTNVCLSATK
jgi:hypothetical protein